MFNGNGGWGDFNGNGGWGGFNGRAVSDDEVEEAQDFDVVQEPGRFDDSEPFWANEEDVEEMWNLFDMKEIQEIQQIIGNNNHLALHQMEDHVNHPGLQQIENNGNHLSLQQIVHNGGVEPTENNGGLRPMLENIEEQLNLEDDPGLQQITGLQQPPHVCNGLMDNLVNLEWLYILTTMNHEPGRSGGSQAHNGGVIVDFNGLGESDEEEEAAAAFGEIAELEPEALEDLGPYWVDDVDNGQEQWNLLNMDPPPDEFFDGVDNDIQGMFGGED
ncbi:hypothetical protein Rs2_21763 [Raphanus sativus]|uniref:Uncharacterized protein LOC130512733 n=1 Tax=Raphanus sativus TaxID=3726 RepID=A0A9W3DTR8_RAPSA|nr:uncharacterized protein LOC130512733 [Raphanus sativus]KAJ4894969.1 hypothetical protein Rs2_21763 [Raphanus sativus]